MPIGGVRELLEPRLRADPDTTAVVCGGERLTWRELAERGDRAADLLIGRGARLETPVGLCAERGAGMVVALLAVLKAGGAVVPLEPGLPGARLAALVASAGLCWPPRRGTCPTRCRWPRCPSWPT